MPLKLLFEKWLVFIKVIPKKNTKKSFLTFHEYHDITASSKTVLPNNTKPCRQTARQIKKPLSTIAAFSHLGIEVVRYIAHF